MKRIPALDLYQTMLNLISGALVLSDRALLRGLVSLPLCVRTARTDVRLSTDDEFQAWLDNAFLALESAKMTGYEQTALHADFVGPNTIRGFHDVRVLRGDTELIRPFQSMMVLSLSAGRMRVTHCDLAITRDMPDALPQAVDELPFRAPKISPQAGESGKDN